MKLYEVIVYGTSADESDPTPQLWTRSIEDARRFARTELGDEGDELDISAHAEIFEAEVITSGRGWVLAILNRKAFVRAGSRKLLERISWLDDGHGGVPRLVSTTPERS